MRVVVTGAAGSIGHRLCGSLAAMGHDVVGADIRAPEGGIEGWRYEQADIGDLATTTGLLRGHGAEGVVHLAGYPGESSLTDALDSHVVLTQTVLKAMTAAGAHRLVYASSNHAVGFTPAADGVAPSGTRPRPDTYYGVGKAAAEALISLWVDRFGIDAVCVRIGSVRDTPRSRHDLAMLLSHADAARLVDACLTAPGVRYEIVWGISANTRGWWDLGPARALGYHPEDDSERVADAILATEEDEASRQTRRFVGGTFIPPERFWETRPGEER